MSPEAAPLTPPAHQPPPASPPGAADAEYRTLDIGRFLRIFWTRRWSIVLWAVAGAALSTAATFVLHPAFDATVTLMPPAPKDTLLATISSKTNDGDLYLGLISSRTVADDVIEHQHLADYFHTHDATELRVRLDRMAKISVDKNQFVTVVVRANEPETAVRIANEFPEVLYRLNRFVALSQATHRREYFEGPLEQEKNQLAEAEEQLKLAQQKTGIVLPEAQAQLGLTAIAQLKQQITSRQEQLAALETGSTEQNPQVIQLKSQIASLAGQLQRLEAQNRSSSPSSANVPELTLEVERRTRDVKYHEALFQILSRQYENARVDESYAPPIELVDRAVLPDHKSWPSRKLFFLIGLIAGGLLGFITAFMKAVRPISNALKFLNQEPPAPRS